MRQIRATCKEACNLMRIGEQHRLYRLLFPLIARHLLPRSSILTERTAAIRRQRCSKLLKYADVGPKMRLEAAGTPKRNWPTLTTIRVHCFRPGEAQGARPERPHWCWQN